jgi:hypothetical protein
MRFWLREIAGWLLVLVGLYVFYLTYVMILNRMIWEAGEWAFIGIIIFRGGIHLLKVAVAARVCTQALDQISGDRAGIIAPRPARQRPQARTRFNGWS